MRGLFFLPIVIFAMLAVFLYRGLFLDPHKIPTALAAKPVPEFTLSTLDGSDVSFSAADLKMGHISLVNVFASWCLPCRVEHANLIQLKARGVAVFGLNYKDASADARSFLGQLGNPYTRIGVDATGRVAIEWGVYGVPETFIVTGEGQIACKHIGPLTDDDLSEKIFPALEMLQRNPKALIQC